MPTLYQLMVWIKVLNCDLQGFEGQIFSSLTFNGEENKNLTLQLEQMPSHCLDNINCLYKGLMKERDGKLRIFSSIF